MHTADGRHAHLLAYGVLPAGSLPNEGCRNQRRGGPCRPAGNAAGAAGQLRHLQVAPEGAQPAPDGVARSERETGEDALEAERAGEQAWCQGEGKKQRAE